MSHNFMRGILIGIGFLVVLTAYCAADRTIAGTLVVCFSLLAAVFLHKNLEVLVNMEDKQSPKFAFLKKLSFWGIVFLVVCTLAALLQTRGLLPAEGANLVAALLVAGFMIVFGNIAPKIPYNKFMGFRLPWTLLDEQTWIVAHRILGYLSWPLGIIYIAMVPYMQDLTKWTMIVFVGLWIGLTALLSALFYLRKFR